MSSHTLYLYLLSSPKYFWLSRKLHLQNFPKNTCSKLQLSPIVSLSPSVFLFLSFYFLSPFLNLSYLGVAFLLSVMCGSQFVPISSTQLRSKTLRKPQNLTVSACWPASWLACCTSSLVACASLRQLIHEKGKPREEAGGRCRLSPLVVQVKWIKWKWRVERRSRGWNRRNAGLR